MEIEDRAHIIVGMGARGFAAQRQEAVRQLREVVAAERERAAQTAQNMRIISGETPGPLFDAGWNRCAAETAKVIREGE